MDRHLSRIWSASAELETLQLQTDRAHETLVQALCEAMAAQIPPAEVAKAGNMSLPELFDALRQRVGRPATIPDYVVHDI